MMTTALRRLLIGGLLSVFFLTGTAWLLSNPPGAQPDDTFHFANIWCPDGVNGFRCETLPDGSRLIPDNLVEGSPWWETSSVLPAIGEQSQYPRLQYSVMRFLASDDVYKSVLLMRFVNLFIALSLIVAAFLLIGSGGKLAVAVTWLTVPIAQGYFLVASNHPISWYYVGIGTLWAFVIGAVRAESWRRRLFSCLFAVVAGVMAAGSRPEGQLMVGFSVVIALLCSLGENSVVQQMRYQLIPKRETSLRWLIVSVSVVSLVILSFRLGSNFTSEMVNRIPTAFSELEKILDTPKIYFNSVSSSVGVAEAPTPGIQTVPAGLAVGFVMFMGLRKMWLSKAVAILLALAAMSVAPQLIVVDERGPMFSPSRYFVAFMLVLVGLMLLRPKGSEEREISTSEQVVLIVPTTLAFSFALHGAINPAGVINPEIWDIDLNQNLKWWWSLAPSPMTVWLVGTLCFGVAQYFVLRMFRMSIRNLNPVFYISGLGVLLLASIIQISANENSFSRPPLSVRPALDSSKPVTWTFLMPFMNPRIDLDSATTSRFLVMDLIDNHVRRIKNGDSSQGLSAELLKVTWSDLESGILGVTIKGLNDGDLNASALADWSEWQLVQGERLRLKVPLTSFGKSSLKIPKSSIDGRLMELQIRVRVGQCPRSESLLKCPFADFAGSDLSQNDFERADLRGVDFTGADFTEAKLNGADLSGAILDGADLGNAYLVGIDLSETSQINLRLDGAIWTR